MGSDDETNGVVRKALGPIAEEFAEASKGSGESLGRSVKTLSRTVEALLTPLSVMVWAYDTIKEKFILDLERKMEKVPEERRILPNVEIAGPAVEALRFTGQNDELRNLFANVLATSMDAETAANAHPSFVEIIKQLSSDDARILRFMPRDELIPMIDISSHEGGKNRYLRIAQNVSRLGELAGCENKHLVQSAIDNLCRLELCNSPHDKFIADEKMYEQVENLPEVKDIVEQAEEGVEIEISRRFLTLTVFGKQFIKACVEEKK